MTFNRPNDYAGNSDRRVARNHRHAQHHLRDPHARLAAEATEAATLETDTAPKRARSHYTLGIMTYPTSPPAWPNAPRGIICGVGLVGLICAIGFILYTMFGEVVK